MGVASVGSVVSAFAITIICFSLANDELGVSFPATSIFLIYFFYLCLQAPADVSGGIVIPLAFHKRKEAPRELILSLAYGVLRHGIINLISLTTLLCGSLMLGRPGLLIASFVNVTMLFLFQSFLLTFVSGIKLRKSDDKKVIVAVGLDSGFTGGVVDSLAGPISVVPSTDIERDSNYINLRQSSIKKLQSTFARLLIPIAINSSGAILALYHLSAYEPSPVRDVIIYSLWATVWSFVCLLFLPYFNRQAVLTLDRYLVKAGLDRLEFEHALSSADLKGEEEYSRTASVQSVFYPIPAPKNRIENIASGKQNQRFWIAFHQVARRTLYSSLGFGGFLSRSVRCNVGRPECGLFFLTLG